MAPPAKYPPKWDAEIRAFRRHPRDPQLRRFVQIEPVLHEPGIFRVESESVIVPKDQDWQEYAHQVDLVSEITFDDNNEPHVVPTCTCESFCRGHDRPICKHIEKCLQVVAWSALEDFIRKMTRLAIHEHLKP